NRLYDVYVKDAYGLGVEGFFAEQNPAAMQDITAVMMETARKGLWQANEEQLQTIADVHIRFVRQFGASGSDFSGSNHKVQDFISQHAAREDAAGYKRRLQQMKTPGAATELQGKGTVLK
ncbi:MAG TPA: hypothetical protein DDZ78_17170, partial [Porphyromonadaceae bacterium]|nr:hypothetical protein [Porphyromonadaceae bacterium]